MLCSYPTGEAALSEFWPGRTSRIRMRTKDANRAESFYLNLPSRGSTSNNVEQRSVIDEIHDSFIVPAVMHSEVTQEVSVLT